MVNINLGRNEVGIHLSSSVREDPEFSFYAFQNSGIMPARGSFRISRPSDKETVFIYIDRRHLDRMINKLVEMRDAIDALEVKDV